MKTIPKASVTSQSEVAHTLAKIHRLAQAFLQEEYEPTFKPNDC